MSRSLVDEHIETDIERVLPPGKTNIEDSPKFRAVEARVRGPPYARWVFAARNSAHATCRATLYGGLSHDSTAKRHHVVSPALDAW